MNLTQQLRDIAKMGVCDEDCLMLEAANQIEKLRTALKRIRDDSNLNGGQMRITAREALK